MFFSTLGLSISNSLKSTPLPSPTPGPEPTPPGPDKSITDKIKEGLRKFAERLKEMEKKSVASLPGIIGTIVSFIIKSAGAAVGFLAEHLIILVGIIVASIIAGLVEGVKIVKEKSIK